MQSVILINKDDLENIEEELQNEFLKDILLNIGLDLTEYWPDDKSILSVEERVKMRSLFRKYNILVVENGGNLEIFVDDELVGNWKRPVYELGLDQSIKDPSKRSFIRIKVDSWSIFDGEDFGS